MRLSLSHGVCDKGARACVCVCVCVCVSVCVCVTYLSLAVCASCSLFVTVASSSYTACVRPAACSLRAATLGRACDTESVHMTHVGAGGKKPSAVALACHAYL